jgi:hypothetical protein
MVLDGKVRQLCVSTHRTEGETVFETSAKFTQPYVTPESPPKLKIEIANPSDENAILEESTQMPNPRWDESDPPGLVFLPNDHPYSLVEAGRWELNPDAELTGSGMAPAVTVELGETVTLGYSVWDSGRTEGYFDLGNYSLRVPLSGEAFTEVDVVVSEQV